MSPVIGWTESSPADGDNAGLGDNEIRSLKTSIRVGLDGEHVWPAGGGNAGVHRLGAARTHYGAQSLVSSTGTDGRLMVTSDSSRLFHVGSVATSFIGGPTVISAGSYPGSVPQRHYWATEFGEGQAKTSASTTVTFPNSGFSGVPFVYATSVRETIFAHPMVGTITGTTFVLSMLDDTGNLKGSNSSFHWFSIGSRVL